MTATPKIMPDAGSDARIVRLNGKIAARRSAPAGCPIVGGIFAGRVRFAAAVCFLKPTPHVTYEKRNINGAFLASMT